MLDHQKLMSLHHGKQAIHNGNTKYTEGVKQTRLCCHLGSAEFGHVLINTNEVMGV